VLIGGSLMMLGHLVLGVEHLPFFYGGLLLLAMGTGLLKPNISTMVGNLYRDRPELRDQAFNIFYMGINIGSFLAPIGVSWIRARYGWSPAFMSAAVAMAISLVIFATFRRHVAAAAVKIDAASAEAAEVPPEEVRNRIVTLMLVFVSSTVFWLAFYQVFFTFTLWARDNTNTTIPPERFSSIEALGILVLTPLLVWIWGALNRRGREPSTPVKMLMGTGFAALAFLLMAYAGLIGGDTGRVSVQFLIWAEVIIALGEICLSPMGMSLVNRLAPPRMRGVMMGGWFVSLSLGGYLSGAVGAYWERMPHSQFFLMVAGVLAIAAIPISIMTPRIKRTIARAEMGHTAIAH
jgi:POT family proton-dependent oligopeptide transporter